MPPREGLRQDTHFVMTKCCCPPASGYAGRLVWVGCLPDRPVDRRRHPPFERGNSERVARLPIGPSIDGGAHSWEMRGSENQLLSDPLDPGREGGARGWC